MVQRYARNTHMQSFNIKKSTEIAVFTSNWQYLGHIFHYYSRIRVMKKQILALIVLFSLSIMVSSCKVKEGCENTEAYQVPVDKDGNMSTKRGKSQLFSDKKTKKRK